MSTLAPRSARARCTALPEIGERRAGIRAGIADDDVAAAPAQQFVETQILEVTAVGEMDAGIFFVETHAEHLAHHEVVPGRPAKPTRLMPRIREPDPEADVQQGHEEADCA
jgi:hypothetical protein